MRSTVARSRLSALMLIAAALLCRALTPLGWMPVAGAAGTTWAICPEALAIRAAEPAAHAAMAHHGARHAAAPAHHGGKDACPFGALASGGADLASPPALVAAPIAAAPPARPRAASSLGRQRFAGHALARGPPVFA